MILFKEGDIVISTLEDTDKDIVLKYFSENDFGCTAEMGIFKPSNEHLLEIMNNIISGKTKEDNIFVLRKQGKVIGYISMFIEYDRLVIGHIAVDKAEQGKGYGTLLINAAIMAAENQDRDVSLFCTHKNSCFKKMGFETNDNLHYFHKNQGIKTPSLPKLFLSIDEYKKKREKHLKEESEKLSKY